MQAPTNAIADPPFKGLRQFNCEAGLRDAGKRHRLAPQWMHWFPGEGLEDRLAHAIAARTALDMKEFTEAFEFFTRTRRRLRAPVLVDMCCGHGFTGLLFAVFSRRVERVVLVDRRRPKSFDAIFEAVCEVAPWVAEKVEYREETVKSALRTIPAGASVIGVHACGGRTDDCLRAAVALGGAVGVMPCCYSRTTPDAPPVLREILGRELCTDVHRTYRLQAAGYTVQWSAIPKAVTDMNRIIIGLPPGTPQQAASRAPGGSS